MKKYLITGAEGQLGRIFVVTLNAQGHTVLGLSKADCDITDYSALERIMLTEQPNVVINCAAYNAVDQAEDERELVFKANARATAKLAEVCNRMDAFLVHYSSNYVFDGTKNNLYTEEDSPNPLNVYGESKREGECAIEQMMKQFLIFRLSWLFGEGKQNFLYKVEKWIREGHVVRVASDEVATPTYTQDVVDMTLAAIEKRLTGLYHLTNSGYASRYEWAKYYLELMGYSNIVIPVNLESFNMKARRPFFACLSSAKLGRELGITIPDWKSGVKRYVEGMNARPQTTDHRLQT